MADRTYITKQGDMWDYIAWIVYGSEDYVPYLYQANPQYLTTYIFDDGIEIICPDVPVTEENEDENLPDWRDSENLDEDEENYTEEEDDT